jgi:hypothetical protein
MRKKYILPTILICLACDYSCVREGDRNTTTDSQLVSNLLSASARFFVSHDIDPIDRMTRLDSAFTDVSEDDVYFIDYTEQMSEIRDRMNNLGVGEPYSVGKYLNLKEQYENLSDKREYRRAIYKPKFKGFSCVVESNDDILKRLLYEVTLDSTKSKIISIEHAIGRYDDKYGFCEFEFFTDSAGLYGVRDYYFKDTLVTSCITSYSTLKELLPSASRSDIVVLINGKNYLLDKRGSLIADIAFDNAIKCVFEDYTYSDILLVKNDGKYGVVNLGSGKFILPCIYDDCTVSSSRIIGTIEGERKEYYPDGTEIKK